jgi:hypothetical protein
MRNGVGRQFDTVSQVELLKQVADVIANRLFGHCQGLGDFLVALALGNQK